MIWQPVELCPKIPRETYLAKNSRGYVILVFWSDYKRAFVSNAGAIKYIVQFAYIDGWANVSEIDTTNSETYLVKDNKGFISMARWNVLRQDFYFRGKIKNGIVSFIKLPK